MKFVLFVAAMLFVFQTYAGAVTDGDWKAKITRDQLEISTVIRMLAEYDEQYKVLKNQRIVFDAPLYAPDQSKICARLYRVYTEEEKMIAYFIVNDESGLQEFSLTDTTPFEELEAACGRGGIKVYTGYDCGLICKGTAQYKSGTLAEAREANVNTAAPRSADALYMPAIYIQNGDTCIPTSMAHDLLFYSTAYPQICNVTNQTTFHNPVTTLKNHMNAGGGSYQAQASIENGFSRYFTQINPVSMPGGGYNEFIFSYSAVQGPSFTAVRNCILSGKPCLLGFAAGSYGVMGHMTLCIDAYILGNHAYYMVTVVDGGSSTTTHVWNDAYNDYFGRLDVSFVPAYE